MAAEAWDGLRFSAVRGHCRWREVEAVGRGRLVGGGGKAVTSLRARCCRAGSRSCRYGDGSEGVEPEARGPVDWQGHCEAGLGRSVGCGRRPLDWTA